MKREKKREKKRKRKKERNKELLMSITREIVNFKMVKMKMDWTELN